MNYKLNPQCVFSFQDGSWLAYNLTTQKSFRCSKEYFKRLQIWGQGKPEDWNRIDQDLVDKRFLIEENPSFWGGDFLSHLCHLSSRNHSETYPRHNEESLVEGMLDLAKNAQIPGRIAEQRLSHLIALPAADSENVGQIKLKEAFLNRRTCRDFYDEPMSLEDLSSILYYCFYAFEKSFSEFDALGLENGVRGRTSPSAAGLTMFDGYVLVQNVSGLENGIYLYHDEVHALSRISASSDYDLSELLCDQFWCRSLPVGLFLVGDMQRVWVKDPLPRGYVSSYLEAGHLSQNIQLLATGLGYKTWITGTFRDDLLSRVLCLEPVQFASFFVGIGAGSGKAFPPEIRERLTRVE